MSLEDRIKHTGEHLLGSLEYDPERSDRITERIVVRARQRRQRAAAGLGAGVVVVIGGLITSTLLTLFVLPAISHLLLRGRHKHHVTGDYGDVDTFGAELPVK